MRQSLPLRGLLPHALLQSAPLRRGAARAVVASAVAAGLLTGTVSPSWAVVAPTATVSSLATATTSSVVASDAFGRTVTGGWGVATLGGAWSTASTGATYSVGSGAGRHQVTSGQTAAGYLGSVSSTSTDVRVEVALNRAAGSGPAAYTSVVGRSIAGVGDYRARLVVTSTGALELHVSRQSTLLKKVALTGLTYASGARMSVRVEVTGAAPTTVRAKAWKAGTTEPTAWQVSATDSTAGLQTAGRVGLSTYVSTTATPVTAAYYGLSVSTVPPANVLPTAAFSATTSGLTVTLDGSVSRDSDGTIASYVWTHGDGTTSSGARVTRTYAAAGTYQSVLTVTDDRGGRATTSRTVTVAAPAPVVTTPRVAALHPFASTSVWNTAIGSGATFESRTGTRTASFLTAKPVINSATWSTPVYRATTSDVYATLKSVRTGQSWTIRIPSHATGALGSAGYTADGHATIIQPDGRTSYDTYKLRKVSSTVWEAQVARVTDLHGSGTNLGVRAAGTPMLAGLIRAHELRERKIDHALAMAVPNTVLKSGFVWPAKSQDADGATAYSGKVPMGTLLAIPGSVNVSGLGLSPEGLALAKALQNYGAYVVDRAGMDALYCETSCDPTATARMATDWKVLQGHMRAVTNSTATTVGGGGFPRVATLAPLG